TSVTIKKHPTPAISPIPRAAIGVTNPDAGVMPTKPQTAPDIAPSTVGFPVRSHSAAIHPRVAVAAAKWVAVKALLASAPADNALPALNPNQPTHSIQAPMTLNTRLCGAIIVFG